MSPSNTADEDQPTFSLPSTGLDSILADDEDDSVNINMVSYKGNVYAAGNSLELATAVTGMKIKRSSDNSEKEVKNLPEPIVIDIPIPNFTAEMRLKDFACVYWNAIVSDW